MITIQMVLCKNQFENVENVLCDCWLFLYPVTHAHSPFPFTFQLPSKSDRRGYTISFSKYKLAIQLHCEYPQCIDLTWPGNQDS